MRLDLAEYTTHYSPINKSVHCDPVTISALVTTAGALGSSAMSSSANSNAANAQANATLQGSREQNQFASNMFNYDNQNNYDAGQYLKGQMPNFDFTKFSAPNGENYFSDKNVNSFYDTSRQNLTNEANNAIGNAQSAFGASAASRGLANPSAGISMAGNQAGQNFIPQFGKLEEGRSNALLNNQQNKYNADFQGAQFNSQQNQILNSLRQIGYGNQNQFASQYGNPNSAYKPFSYSQPTASQPTQSTTSSVSPITGGTYQGYNIPSFENKRYF